MGLLVSEKAFPWGKVDCPKGKTDEGAAEAPLRQATQCEKVIVKREERIENREKRTAKKRQEARGPPA